MNNLSKNFAIGTIGAFVGFLSSFHMVKDAANKSMKAAYYAQEAARSTQYLKEKYDEAKITIVTNTFKAEVEKCLNFSMAAENLLINSTNCSVAPAIRQFIQEGRKGCYTAAEIYNDPDLPSQISFVGIGHTQASETDTNHLAALAREQYKKMGNILENSLLSSCPK